MKKLLLASLMLLSASAFGHSTPVSTASTEIRALAIVIPQITVSEHNPLDFGILLPEEKHNTEVPGQGTAARINVFGKGEGQNVSGAKVRIGCDSTVTLTEPRGIGRPLKANLRVSNGTNFESGNGGIGSLNINLDVDGHSHFFVHGNMTNGANASGHYNGTFTVFARYDQKFPM